MIFSQVWHNAVRWKEKITEAQILWTQMCEMTDAVWLTSFFPIFEFVSPSVSWKFVDRLVRILGTKFHPNSCFHPFSISKLPPPTFLQDVYSSDLLERMNKHVMGNRKKYTQYYFTPLWYETHFFVSLVCRQESVAREEKSYSRGNHEIWLVNREPFPALCPVISLHDTQSALIHSFSSILSHSFSLLFSFPFFSTSTPSKLHSLKVTLSLPSLSFKSIIKQRLLHPLSLQFHVSEMRTEWCTVLRFCSHPNPYSLSTLQLLLNHC